MTGRTGACEAASVSLCLLATILALTACHSYHIDTTIENRTGAAIQLLEVDYPSASFGVDHLDAGAVFHYRFQVRGSGPAHARSTPAPLGSKSTSPAPRLPSASRASYKSSSCPAAKPSSIPNSAAQP